MFRPDGCVFGLLLTWGQNTNGGGTVHVLQKLVQSIPTPVALSATRYMTVQFFLFEES